MIRPTIGDVLGAIGLGLLVYALTWLPLIAGAQP
jgi:hypothetical protein